MKYDIGMFCETCGCVTIFQAGATTPRRCARCDEREPPYVPPLRDRPTCPGLGARRTELSHVGARRTELSHVGARRTELSHVGARRTELAHVDWLE